LPGYLAALSSLVLLALLFTGFISDGLVPGLALLAALAMYAYLGARQPAGLDAADVVRSWGTAFLTLSSIFLVLFTFDEMRTRVEPIFEIMRQVLGGRAKFVFPLDMQVIALAGSAAGLLAFFVTNTAYRRLDHDAEPGRSALLGMARWIFGLTVAVFAFFNIGAIESLRASIVALGRVDADALAQVTDMRLANIVRDALFWPQFYTVLLGSVLIGLAYLFWTDAQRRQTTTGMLGMLVMGIMLIVGGWMFIGELPNAAASGDSEFYQSLLRTATYAAVTVPMQLGLGLLLAYLLFHEISFGKDLYRVIYFIPYIAPAVATAAVFSVIFSLSPDAPANQILKTLGLPPQQWLREQRGVFEIIAQLIGGRQTQLPSFLVGPSLPLVSVIIYSIWVFSGYNAVIFMAGLGAVPREMYEAAQVDGAGRWASFRHITFPLISPTTFFLTILAVIGTFRAFTHIYVLRSPDARGAMDTTTVYIFEIIREVSKPRPYAAAISFLLFGIIVLLTIYQNRLAKDRVFYG
jgi:multiple sugar transport system permease protein